MRSSDPCSLLALLLAALLAFAPLAGAQEPADDDLAFEDDELAFEDDELYFEDDLEEEDDGDPFEPMNRGIFWVNDGLDRYAVEPVSIAWDWVFPDFAKRALRNGFDNLRFPIVFFNHLFQLKMKNAGKDVARFAINTTVGIGGLMDPAASIGLEKRFEDFGQTLGFWGVPPGPYLMLPFFGPSNVRDGFGLIVDTAFRAFGFFIPFVASLAMQGVDTLNRRSLIREAIQSERAAALDWYSAVRSAYTQYRENQVNDRRGGAETESSYYLQPEGPEGPAGGNESGGDDADDADDSEIP
jgi:phospholipid-binding lipoprotein MlaA